MNQIVRQAVASVRATFSDEDWLTMVPGQQTSLIYHAIRRLDQAHAAPGTALFGLPSGEPRQSPALAESMAL